ncbi:MAG: DinB family protein [Bacteroidota bacterium]
MRKSDIAALPDFYQRYVDQVPDNTLINALEDSRKAFIELIKSIPDERGSYAYEEGKWSINQLVSHLNDSERVFCYRALRFARFDQTELEGFEQDDYAKVSGADSRKLSDIIKEFEHIRFASIDLFSGFDDQQLNATGIASQTPISVAGIGYIIAGHVIHHTKVLRERYL